MRRLSRGHTWQQTVTGCDLRAVQLVPIWARCVRVRIFASMPATVCSSSGHLLASAVPIDSTCVRSMAAGAFASWLLEHVIAKALQYEKPRSEIFTCSELEFRLRFYIVKTCFSGYITRPPTFVAHLAIPVTTADHHRDEHSRLREEAGDLI